MIQTLPFAQFSQVRPLFQRLMESQPMCSAVLDGIYPGKVYADDPAQPCTAVLTTFIESEAHGIWCFLAGDPDNDAFNRALNAAIFSNQMFGNQVPVLFLTCDPDDWNGHMGAVLAPRPPIWFRRNHFISRNVSFDWRSALPPGFTVEPMTGSLRQLPGVQLPEDVDATLSKWQAMTDPRFMDYGFVTLDHSGRYPVIASWASVDFIAAGAGDLGFFTLPDYRRRSLGTIAVSAALEHGFSKGLKQVNWTCDADNPGSARTAVKLGLERIEDYHQAVLVMDEKRHTALFQQQNISA